MHILLFLMVFAVVLQESFMRSSLTMAATKSSDELAYDALQCLALCADATHAHAYYHVFTSTVVSVVKLQSDPHEVVSISGAGKTAKVCIFT